MTIDWNVKRFGQPYLSTAPICCDVLFPPAFLTAGEERHRRQSKVRFWDLISASRSNSVWSAGYSDGLGSSSVSAAAAARGGAQELPALLTGIIRDNFLTQVWESVGMYLAPVLI